MYIPHLYEEAESPTRMAYAILHRLFFSSLECVCARKCIHTFFTFTGRRHKCAIMQRVKIIHAQRKGRESSAHKRG